MKPLLVIAAQVTNNNPQIIAGLKDIEKKEKEMSENLTWFARARDVEPYGTEYAELVQRFIAVARQALWADAAKTLETYRNTVQSPK